MKIDWKAVLEIESFVNHVIANDLSNIERIYYSRDPTLVDITVTVDKSKAYDFFATQEYFKAKYKNPKDFLFVDNNLMAIFIEKYSGTHLCNIEENLLLNNSGVSRLQTPEIKEYYFSHVENSIFIFSLFQQISHFALRTRQLDGAVQSDLINYLSGIFDLEVRKSINFDEGVITGFGDLVTEKSILVFDKLNKSAESFALFHVNRSLERNNYPVIYSQENISDFISEFINYSINSYVKSISVDDQQYIAFELNPNISPFAQKDKYGTGKIFLTPLGLQSLSSVNFTSVRDQIKNVIPDSFKILDRKFLLQQTKAGLYSTGIYDSSLIIGTEVVVHNFFNEHIDGNQDFIKDGYMWIHDDHNLMRFSYLGLHDDQDVVKEGIPFTNVLKKYFAAQLDRFHWKFNEDNWAGNGLWLSKDHYLSSQSDPFDF